MEHSIQLYPLLPVSYLFHIISLLHTTLRLTINQPTTWRMYRQESTQIVPYSSFLLAIWTGEGIRLVLMAFWPPRIHRVTGIFISHYTPLSAFTTSSSTHLLTTTTDSLLTECTKEKDSLVKCLHLQCSKCQKKETLNVFTSLSTNHFLQTTITLRPKPHNPPTINTRLLYSFSLELASLPAMANTRYPSNGV
jgi:hypothetical protein